MINNIEDEVVREEAAEGVEKGVAVVHVVVVVVVVAVNVGDNGINGHRTFINHNSSPSACCAQVS